ncbi:MAG: hypothetical protein ACYDCS_01600 [Candidatus Dormibacteria bacterium]
MIRPLIRVMLAMPLLATGIGAASSIARVGPAAPACARAASVHRAGLLVEHGDGQVIRRCVGFGTPTATALALLQASGLEVGTSSYGGGLGTAVCQIDNEPPTYPSGCFTASGSYWVLFVSRAGGAWVNSDLGASSVMLAAGDDIGFRYDPQTGADPPPPPPAGTCPTATPPPARTQTPAVRAASAPRATSQTQTTPLSPAATPPPTATPTGDVLGLATPAASAVSVGSSPRPGAPPGISPGLLLAAVGAGGLIGLLSVRTLRRHRA